MLGNRLGARLYSILLKAQQALMQIAGAMVEAGNQLRQRFTQRLMLKFQCMQCERLANRQPNHATKGRPDHRLAICRTQYQRPEHQPDQHENPLHALESLKR